MEIAAEAGFKGTGIRYDRLEEYLAAGNSLADAKRLASNLGLLFTEAAFLAEWQFHGGVPLVCRRSRSGDPDETGDSAIARMKAFFEACEFLECPNATAVPSLSLTGPLEQAAEDFACLCDAALPHGVRICLEFMGSAPQFGTLASAIGLVEAAGRSNGGILVDTFLFHQGGSSLADLSEAPIDRIFNVQLADAKPMPPAELDMLKDRLYPGEGAAPVREIASILAARGYTGPWTVELFNPDYQAADPGEVARKSYETAASILREAHTPVETN